MKNQPFMVICWVSHDVINSSRVLQVRERFLLYLDNVPQIQDVLFDVRCVSVNEDCELLGQTQTETVDPSDHGEEPGDGGHAEAGHAVAVVHIDLDGGGDHVRNPLGPVDRRWGEGDTLDLAVNRQDVGGKKLHSDQLRRGGPEGVSGDHQAVVEVLRERQLQLLCHPSQEVPGTIQDPLYCVEIVFQNLISVNKVMPQTDFIRERVDI